MAELGFCRSDLLLAFGRCSARNWPAIPEPLPLTIAWDRPDLSDPSFG